MVCRLDEPPPGQTNRSIQIPLTCGPTCKISAARRIFHLGGMRRDVRARFKVLPRRNTRRMRARTCRCETRCQIPGATFKAFLMLRDDGRATHRQAETGCRCDRGGVHRGFCPDVAWSAGGVRLRSGIILRAPSYRGRARAAADEHAHRAVLADKTLEISSTCQSIHNLHCDSLIAAFSHVTKVQMNRNTNVIKSGRPVFVRKIDPGKRVA